MAAPQHRVFRAWACPKSYVRIPAPTENTVSERLLCRSSSAQWILECRSRHFCVRVPCNDQFGVVPQCSASPRPLAGLIRTFCHRIRIDPSRPIDTGAAARTGLRRYPVDKVLPVLAARPAVLCTVANSINILVLSLHGNPHAAHSPGPDRLLFTPAKRVRKGWTGPAIGSLNFENFLNRPRNHDVEEGSVSAAALTQPWSRKVSTCWLQPGDVPYSPYGSARGGCRTG